MHFPVLTLLTLALTVLPPTSALTLNHHRLSINIATTDLLSPLGTRTKCPIAWDRDFNCGCSKTPDDGDDNDGPYPPYPPFPGQPDPSNPFPDHSTAHECESWVSCKSGKPEAASAPDDCSMDQIRKYCLPQCECL